MSIKPTDTLAKCSYTKFSPLTTAGETGSAVLVVEGDDLKALKLWLKVVGRIHPETVEEAFPDQIGVPLRHLER